MTWATLGARIAAAAAVGAAGWLIVGWLPTTGADALDRQGVDPAVRRALLGPLRLVLLALVVATTMATLGIQVEGLDPLLAGVAFALSLAARQPIENLAAGAWLLQHRPYQEGDWVELAGREGRLARFGWSETTLILGSGERLSLPNSLVVQAPMTNHSRATRRKVTLTLEVPGDQLAQAEARLLAAATDLPERVDPPPSVRAALLAPGQVRLRLEVWVQPEAFEAASDALTRRVAAS
jgi:small conductance mechanosensitive channel